MRRKCRSCAGPQFLKGETAAPKAAKKAAAAPKKAAAKKKMRLLREAGEVGYVADVWLKLRAAARRAAHLVIGGWVEVTIELSDGLEWDWLQRTDDGVSLAGDAQCTWTLRPPEPQQ